MNNHYKIQSTNLTLPFLSRYTKFNSSLLKINNIMKFLSAYALLWILAASLTLLAWQQISLNPEMSALFYINILSTAWIFAFLGIGLGLFTLIIAAIMSWLQLALLITGNIDPHLTEARFFKVLSTIIGR